MSGTRSTFGVADIFRQYGDAFGVARVRAPQPVPAAPDGSHRSLPDRRARRSRRVLCRPSALANGNLKHLSDHSAFDAVLTSLHRIEWLVYANRPFSGPEQVLAYLARYTRRVAISNHRLRAVDNDGATFSWCDMARCRIYRSNPSVLRVFRLSYPQKPLLSIIFAAIPAAGSLLDPTALGNSGTWFNTHSCTIVPAVGGGETSAPIRMRLRRWGRTEGRA